MSRAARLTPRCFCWRLTHCSHLMAMMRRQSRRARLMLRFHRRCPTRRVGSASATLKSYNGCGGSNSVSGRLKSATASLATATWKDFFETEATVASMSWR